MTLFILSCGFSISNFPPSRSSLLLSSHFKATWRCSYSVKRVSGCEKNMDVVLLFSAMPKEIHMSLLSDDDFSEGDLQQKAKILHEDLTKHIRCNCFDVVVFIVTEEKTHHGNASSPERKQLISEGSVLVESQHGHTPGSEPEHDNITSEKPLQPTAQQKKNKLDGEDLEIAYKQAAKMGRRVSEIDVIELVSDDENANENKSSNVVANQKIDDLESKTWCIQGPNGERDKCSLSVLRLWSESTPYASRFKVWKEDENEENAIWLREAIRIAFPKK